MAYVMLTVFIVAIILLAEMIISEKIEKKVLESSKKITALLNLNDQIMFHQIPDCFKICKHYDNKSSYNKIEPAYLMTAEIRSKIIFFSDYITKVRENREKNIQYMSEIDSISSTEYVVDYAKLNISERTYKRHEKQLFEKKILTPVVSCLFTVDMSYSSPKGKVNLSKSDSFDFDDMFACLESVSRSRLDRDTYSQIAVVERGEVSDSLRYDILNRDNFTCVICGVSSRQGARLHVDHIIPISKGGKSVPDNLRTLCERCNIGKSNKIEFSSQSPEEHKQEDLICERCGGNLVLKKGKYGVFYGCTNYPKCKFTKKL